LGEATILPRRVSELSEGQKFRLRLAAGMQRALGGRGSATLMVDEFAASLDRVTARSVAHTLARWVRRERSVRLVVATAHDDVLEWLGPDALVFVPLDGECECRWAVARAGGGAGARGVRPAAEHTLSAGRAAGAERSCRVSLAPGGRTR